MSFGEMRNQFTLLHILGLVIGLSMGLSLGFGLSLCFGLICITIGLVIGFGFGLSFDVCPNEPQQPTQPVKKIQTVKNTQLIYGWDLEQPTPTIPQPKPHLVKEWGSPRWR